MNFRFPNLVLPLAVLLSQASLQIQAQTPEAEPKTISAGPFSITAPAAWAGTAYAEKVPANPLYSEAAWNLLQESSLNTLKPYYGNRPLHRAIRFPALALKGEKFDPSLAGEDPTAPQILIHQTDGWASVMSNGMHTAKEADAKRKEMRNDLDALDKSVQGTITPAYMDASLSFTCLKKKLSFKGGHGYRVLTQWTIEPDLVRRSGIHYLFVGLSDDNSCQIVATFPVDAPGLPAAEGYSEHLGYSNRRYEELTNNFEVYSAAAVTWIEKHQKEFTPSLEALDRLIESLSADTWR